jgi:glycosyltransferase involved in cell wall biosynthesis
MNKWFGMNKATQETLLLVCNTAWGIANFRANLIQHWVAQGKRVVAIAPRDAVAEAKLLALGASFEPLALDNRGSNPWQEIKVIWQLVRLYRTYQPKLVVHYTIKPVIYGSWAAWLAGVASLAVVTGQGFVFLNTGAKAWLARNLYRLSLRFAKGVWFLNQDDYRLFTESGLAPTSKSAILPGEGVDTQFFAPRSNSHQDGVVRLLLIARLLFDKGIAEFAQAGSLLKHQHDDVLDHHAINPRNHEEHDDVEHLSLVQLQLLGPFYPQNPQAITPEVVAHWQSEGWLKYLGETSDVREYIADCDALVLPSYAEGLPRTVLEAMSMAKPVIATDVVGCRDLVIDGETGILCEARSAEALAEAIRRFLLLSPQARAEMGEAGRSRVLAHFADAQVMATYDAFLLTLTD